MKLLKQFTLLMITAVYKLFNCPCFSDCIYISTLVVYRAHYIMSSVCMFADIHYSSTDCPSVAHFLQ